MKRIFGPRAHVVAAWATCFFGLMSLFCHSTQADIICSTATVTGFANSAGGVGDNTNPPASFTIELTGLGTDAPGSGFLDLTTFGDFSNAGEYIDVSIEGVSLGRLWDNVTTNDSFEGSVADNDRGLEYGQNFSTEPANASARAQLTESQLDEFLADGTLIISFDAFGAEVNNLVRDEDEFITALVVINDTAVVPEPSSFLFAALAGVVATVRRKRIA